MSSEETAISIDGVSKCYRVYGRPLDRLKQSLFPWKTYYKEHWALQPLKLQVGRGESIGIIGRNGSGKSTLLQCLAGTLTPTQGSVALHGKVAALLELGAGFNAEFSGRENIKLSAMVLGLSQEEVDERFASIAEFSGIEEFLDQPVKTYSSGMFARLAFAVVAHVDADILIIDEALAVGDTFFVQKCMRYLKDFQQHGTVFFVSHDVGSVMNLCNRAVWLDKGEAQLVGDPKEVCEAYLAHKYAEDMGIAYNPGPQRPDPADADPGVPVAVGPQQPKEAPAPLVTTTQHLSGIWFNEQAEGFGTGKATIDNVELLSTTGEKLELLHGGEQVCIRVSVSAVEEFSQPIVGFSIKDRLGQHLIGENSAIVETSQPITVGPGEQVIAEFIFAMPLLLTGEYSICAAVASGTLHDHVQHRWTHDALMFTVHSSSLAGVHVGVPMSEVRLSKQA